MVESYLGDWYLQFNEDLGDCSRLDTKGIGGDLGNLQVLVINRISQKVRTNVFIVSNHTLNLEHSFILFYFLTSPFLCNSHSGSNQEILSLNLGANWSDDGGFLGVSLDLELISGVPSNSSSSSFLLYPLVSPPKKLKSRTSPSRPLMGGDS